MTAPTLCLMGSNPTGEAPFSCALAIGSDVHVARSTPGRRGDLALLARELCAAHGVPVAAIGALRLDLGPGSYTGLRVAVTFARFLQHFGGVQVHATDTLAVVALCAPPARRIVPVLDARRGRLHTAALHERDGVLRQAAPPQALLPDEFRALLRPGDVVVGPAATAALVAPLLAGAEVAFAAAAGIDAAHLLSPRLALAPRTVGELEPHYLMASYAE